MTAHRRPTERGVPAVDCLEGSVARVCLQGLSLESLECIQKRSNQLHNNQGIGWPEEYLFVLCYFVSEGHRIHTEISGGTNTGEGWEHVSCLDVGGPCSHARLMLRTQHSAGIEDRLPRRSMTGCADWYESALR